MLNGIHPMMRAILIMVLIYGGTYLNTVFGLLCLMTGGWILGWTCGELDTLKKKVEQYEPD